jgi:hypothetical protein
LGKITTQKTIACILKAFDSFREFYKQKINKDILEICHKSINLDVAVNAQILDYKLLKDEQTIEYLKTFLSVEKQKQ